MNKIIYQKRSFKRKYLSLVLSACLVPGMVMAVESTTYTSDTDFESGILNGFNFEVTGQLQLNDTATTFPTMWVANASEATVSKIDTDENCETGRYKTWFAGGGSPWGGAAPSRTAVDSDGNVYVANRHFDGRKPLIMKILSDSFIDRNGNGVLDTSHDTNGDCRVTGSEILPLTDLNADGRLQNSELVDERIAWVAEVGDAGRLGRSLCIGNDGNLWLGTYNDYKYYKVSSDNGSVMAGPYNVSPVRPYGCVVDSDGILYSAGLSQLMGILNTNTGQFEYKNHGYHSYGIAIGNGKVYPSNRSGRSFTEYDPLTNAFSTPAGYTGVTSFGISVDGAGDILVGRSSGGMYKYRPDGSIIWSSPAQAGTGAIRGVVADANGDAWAVHVSNHNISKFDGATGTHLGVYPVGTGPYTYSDATGIGVRGSTSLTGLWTKIEDSGEDDSTWGILSWNDLIPTGGSIVVKIRTANTEAGLELAVYQDVLNGEAAIDAIGRYAQIQVKGTAGDDKESPVLYDLTAQWELDAPPLIPPVMGLTPQATEILEGSTFSATGTFSDPDNTTGWIGTVDYGDGTVEDLVIDETNMSFLLEHIYGDDDLYTVTVMLSDIDAGMATESLDITVLNVAPVVEQAAIEPLAAIDTDLMLNIDYSDPGFLDTHTVEVDWGDATAIEIIPVDNVNNSATGTHSYDGAGVYTLITKVIDDDTGEVTETIQYVVIFDPSAGFVTGGGYIDSPAGAYVNDPSLVGRANYGFVAKYKKGKSIPDGQTQFQFKAGSLNFHSTSYEWLVVAGSRGQFKGHGTINGEGDYGFMLTVIDEAISNAYDEDQFRMKVWDIDTGDIVYDNRLDEADDSSSLTPVSGGNIVIHSGKGK